MSPLILPSFTRGVFPIAKRALFLAFDIGAMPEDLTLKTIHRLFPYITCLLIVSTAYIAS
jgi:hypothetical protein